MLGACSGGGSLPAVPDTVAETAFTTVSDAKWDNTAVRQVLHVFALGGYATDQQIQTWADMPPATAIVEIITFAPFNQRISSGRDAGNNGTLAGMSAHWTADSSQNIMAPDHRESFSVNRWSGPERTWFAAMSRTGANPVRQRIGLFETNYHLSVNQDAEVNNWQMMRYYDDIMNAHNSRLPYEKVMAIAAQSAAVATQYNHRHNQFINARFEGNEDFAREFHQLFFGILGVNDPDHHELVTIRNTAKLLTDMPVERIGKTSSNNAHNSATVTFGDQYHYPGPLEILGGIIETNTAAPGIDRAAEIAITHPESMANLPLIVVKFLADDILDDTETEAIQAAWSSLESRSLLDFIRAYAISTTFHSPTRVKRWSSIERNVIISSLSTLTRDEVTRRFFDPSNQISEEGVRVFRPLKNVFGGQTGLDALASGDVFRAAYNQSVEDWWRYGRYYSSQDGRHVWNRDWAAAIPKVGGEYAVRDVAEWLWQRYIADGLDNFGTLERAHVYALLGSGRDFASFVSEDNPMQVYTVGDMTTSVGLQELIGDMEIARMDLDSSSGDDRQDANQRVGQAINFIIATPYAFAQEGR